MVAEETGNFLSATGRAELWEYHHLLSWNDEYEMPIFFGWNAWPCLEESHKSGLDIMMVFAYRKLKEVEKTTRYLIGLLGDIVDAFFDG